MAQYRRRRGYSALYQWVSRLQDERGIRCSIGAFSQYLLQVAKTDVSILNDLLKIIDDRGASKTTIITNQFLIDHFHA
ncbi:ATP-binding protein [Glaciimonas immobilis]|uniref:Uncharacterized protein n=1 Tax=Glaciimonas immobilis TaxID=728004 RepID=A0A840RQI2_9BURK|nr:ATP-binding protein [Glaciimonas immobilis]KAF3999378.1 ATP-binding protein [Glaciimonas immobilis]MBB5198870.1 hypothetical protein [Glaciimonas immobilis]